MIHDQQQAIAFEAAQQVFGYTPEELRNKSRVAPLPWVRQLVAWALAKEFRQHPDQAARAINRTRPYVKHCVFKVRSLSKYDRTRREETAAYLETLNRLRSEAFEERVLTTCRGTK